MSRVGRLVQLGREQGDPSSVQVPTRLQARNIAHYNTKDNNRKEKNQQETIIAYALTAKYVCHFLSKQLKLNIFVFNV